MHYLSITAFTGNYGAGQDRLGRAGFLHGGDLIVDDDGRFEIFVGPERRGDNWLQTSPEPNLIAIRQFFLDRDAEVPISMRIECLDHDDLPSPLSAERFGRALESAAAFVAGCSAIFTDWVDDLGADARNALTLEAGPMQGAWGDPNQIFRHGAYDLDEGEALLIEFPRRSASTGTSRWTTAGWRASTTDGCR